MQKAKKVNSQQPRKRKNWLLYINESLPRLAVPIGPRFQAAVPDWTGEPSFYPNDDSYSSKRLGTRVWPVEEARGHVAGKGRDRIGQGRSDTCPCISPGSAECAKIHIAEKRIQLQRELGPAFWSWEFDKTGEEVSKSWTLQEEITFGSIVKKNPLSQGRSFLKPALQCLPSKSHQSIVCYYFNVYVPRRISLQTRAGCKIIDTDDDENEAIRSSRNSQKRDRDYHVTFKSSKHVKSQYLVGRR